MKTIQGQLTRKNGNRLTVIIEGKDYETINPKAGDLLNCSFEEWIRSLDTQVLTEELVGEIIERHCEDGSFEYDSVEVDVEAIDSSDIDPKCRV